jgi:hypothetical protein
MVENICLEYFKNETKNDLSILFLKIITTSNIETTNFVFINNENNQTEICMLNNLNNSNNENKIIIQTQLKEKNT